MAITWGSIVYGPAGSSGTGLRLGYEITKNGKTTTLKIYSETRWSIQDSRFWLDVTFNGSSIVSQKQSIYTYRNTTNWGKTGDNSNIQLQYTYETEVSGEYTFSASMKSTATNTDALLYNCSAKTSGSDTTWNVVAPQNQWIAIDVSNKITSESDINTSWGASAGNDYSPVEGYSVSLWKIIGGNWNVSNDTDKTLIGYISTGEATSAIKNLKTDFNVSLASGDQIVTSVCSYTIEKVWAPEWQYSNVVTIEDFCSIFIKKDGIWQKGVLYARDSSGDFKPVKELYQRQENDLVKIK